MPKDEPVRHCPHCGGEMPQGICWLLSCAANGGTGEAFAMLLLRDRAMRACERNGRLVQRSHPSTWPEPPDQEFMF